MLAKIKVHLTAGLAFLTAIFAALFYRERSKFKDAQLKGEQSARKTEQQATEAMIKGLKNEAEINQNNNPVDRDYFNK